tara:strand:- start:385 stop:528 length:144 start_codon:yes stop_codon:yes gene_type:complete
MGADEVERQEVALIVIKQYIQHPHIVLLPNDTHRFTVAVCQMVGPEG